MKDKTIHQFSAGVNILLERIKTNPEDFEPDGKFDRLVEHVYIAMDKGEYEGIKGRGAFLRMLTREEIIALHDALVEAERPKFDAYVMKEILGSEDKYEAAIQGVPAHQWYSSASAQNASSAGFHPSMLQNAITPPVGYSQPPKPKSFWSKFFNGMVGR